MPRAQARPCRRVRDGVTIKVYKIINILFCAQNSLGRARASAAGPRGAARGRGGAQPRPWSEVRLSAEPQLACSRDSASAQGRHGVYPRSPRPLIYRKRPTLYSPHAALVTVHSLHTCFTPLHVELKTVFAFVGYSVHVGLCS